jgi:hypothetical protein
MRVRLLRAWHPYQIEQRGGTPVNRNTLRPTVRDANLDMVLPNLRNFGSLRDLSFMDPA